MLERDGGPIDLAAMRARRQRLHGPHDIRWGYSPNGEEGLWFAVTPTGKRWVACHPELVATAPEQVVQPAGPFGELLTHARRDGLDLGFDATIAAMTELERREYADMLAGLEEIGPPCPCAAWQEAEVDR